MFIVKMTKCRQMCTMGYPPDVTRRGRQIPPQVPQTSCSWDLLLIRLSAVFSTVQFYDVLHLILTETGIWGPLVTEA